MDRREFLQFLGVTGALATMPTDLLASKKKTDIFKSLPPTTEDKLLTASGLDYKVLIRWGDPINASQKFGFNNDFIAFHKLEKDRALLWVNHEYIHPLFINGNERSKTNVDAERLEVGGSIIEVKKERTGWKLVKDSSYNRRLDANTEIPFAWDEKIKNTNKATGTFAGCAGGTTPWGTFLSCEENYDMFTGDRDREGNFSPSYTGWEKIYPEFPPEHYGWVVEIEPKTGKAKKLVSLGRFAHECAAVTKAKNGKVIAYTGDDSADEHLYKFISDSSDSLEKGKLYVASLEKGEWLSMDIEDQPVLKKNFKNQTEVQIFAREAAKMIGATPLDRPEDIDFDPLNGHVLVALTNNKKKNNFHGSILKIIEKDNDPGSLKFTHETFLAGGPETGFACPDNMVFDPKGNLWFTSDMSGDQINTGPYQGLGNNSLFVFMRTGSKAGEVIRVTSAPVDAEFTGPCFSPDYKTLFLSVQHPGEQSTSLEKLTSHWPDGNGKIPRPSVVTLQGPLLDQIVKGKL